MSCDDCARASRTRRLMLERLNAAAQAHGFELWTRIGPTDEVLVIPTAAEHGEPETLIETFRGMGAVGFPRTPAARRRQHASRPAKIDRSPEAGHIGYRLDTTPPVMLVFITKLLKNKEKPRDKKTA
jgi:hypothetical protein